MSRPNILIVMGDAARPDYIGALGEVPIRTPALDRLTTEGVTFDRTYCAAAQCAPSRTSFVTGLYPHTHGVMFNEVEMPEHHRSIAHYLGEVGYRSAWLGKSHNMPARADFGFDVQKLSECGRLPMYDDDYFCWLHDQGVEKDEIYRLWNDVWNVQVRPFDRYQRPRRYGLGIPAEFSFSFWLAAETRGFIDECTESNMPFLAFVSHHAPQNEDAVPERFLEMYDPELIEPPAGVEDRKAAQRIIADFMAKTTMLDESTGRIISHLEERGILDDTIVIYTADHACFLGEKGIWNKMWTYERDTRIPFVIRYPEFEPQRIDAFCSNIDAVPTLLDLLGVEQPEQLQGVSQLPVIRGELAEVRKTIYTESGPAGKQRKGVWSDRYKLLYRSGIDKVELYDLVEDPEERNDLADDPAYTEVKSRLVFAMLEEIVKTERYPISMSERSRKNQESLFNRL